MARAAGTLVTSAWGVGGGGEAGGVRGAPVDVSRHKNFAIWTFLA